VIQQEQPRQVERTTAEEAVVFREIPKLSDSPYFITGADVFCPLMVISCNGMQRRSVKRAVFEICIPPELLL